LEIRGKWRGVRAEDGRMGVRNTAREGSLRIGDIVFRDRKRSHRSSDD